MCEYTSPGFLWSAGRHDGPASWTLPKASHKADTWPQEGLWVVCSLLSRREGIQTFFLECSTCCCVLLIMEITENLQAPQIIPRAKQSWEFCCLLPQDKCHDRCISNICYGCISLYVAWGTDQWFFIQGGKCLPPCNNHTPRTLIQPSLGSDSVPSALESNGCVSLCREGGPESQAGVEHLGQNMWNKLYLWEKKF